MKCETCGGKRMISEPLRFESVGQCILHVPCHDCGGTGQQHCCDGPAPTDEDVREGHRSKDYGRRLNGATERGRRRCGAVGRPIEAPPPSEPGFIFLVDSRSVGG